MKTCTIGPTFRLDQDPSLHSDGVMGPFTNPLLTDPGYFGEWREVDGYLDTTVQTRRGGGAITSVTTSELVERYFTYLACASTPDGGFTLGYAPEAACSGAGVYPPEIDY